MCASIRKQVDGRQTHLPPSNLQLLLSNFQAVPRQAPTRIPSSSPSAAARCCVQAPSSSSSFPSPAGAVPTSPHAVHLNHGSPSKHSTAAKFILHATPRRGAQQGPQLGSTMKKAGTIHMSLQRRPSPERQTTPSNSMRTDHHVACLRALLAVAIKVGGQAIYQRRPSPHLGQSSPLLQWAGERGGGALTTAGAAYHDFIRRFHPIPFPRVQPARTRPIFSLSSVLLHCDSVGAHESKPWTRQVTLGKVWSIHPSVKLCPRVAPHSRSEKAVVVFSRTHNSVDIDTEEKIQHRGKGGQCRGMLLWTRRGIGFNLMSLQNHKHLNSSN